MDANRYRPWRSESQTPSMLDDDAARHWHTLLADSRQRVDQLTALTSQVDQQIRAGAQVLAALRTQNRAEADSPHFDEISRRLDSFDHRLAAMEHAMLRVLTTLRETAPEPAPPIVHPLRQPPHNSPHQPRAAA